MLLRPTASRLFTPLFATCIGTGMALSAIGFSGCSDRHEGNERASSTVSSIKQSRAEIVEAKNEIGTASANLNLIIHQADLKPAFDGFTDNVAKIKTQEKRMRTQREKMQANSEEYLREWQTEVAQFSNDDLKRANIDRQADVKKQFAETTRAYQELNDLYTPFLKNLSEIQLSLSHDLTPAEAKSIKPVAETAMADGEKVQAKADDLIAKLDTLSASFSSVNRAATK